MYEPEVDDYVIWERPNGDHEQGWVYFKGDVVDNEKRVKNGWNPVPRYITIETGVRPKPYCEHAKGDPHKMIHTLLLCYESYWNELRYVKHRRTRECNHWSQYDDIHGNEEPIVSNEDRMTEMYKSQEGRPPDY